VSNRIHKRFTINGCVVTIRKNRHDVHGIMGHEGSVTRDGKVVKWMDGDRKCRFMCRPQSHDVAIALADVVGVDQVVMMNAWASA
jgi:hypothetical protein